MITFASTSIDQKQTLFQNQSNISNFCYLKEIKWKKASFLKFNHTVFINILQCLTILNKIALILPQMLQLSLYKLCQTFHSSFSKA